MGWSRALAAEEEPDGGRRSLGSICGTAGLGPEEGAASLAWRFLRSQESVRPSCSRSPSASLPSPCRSVVGCRAPPLAPGQRGHGAAAAAPPPPPGAPALDKPLQAARYRSSAAWGGGHSHPVTEAGRVPSHPGTKDRFDAQFRAELIKTFFPL